MNHTTTTGTSNPNWLVDSAASHHVTRDLRNLSTHGPYHGYDSIIVGNGMGLGISHTSSTSFCTSNSKFYL